MSSIDYSSWLNTVSGKWTAAADWSPAGVPTYNAGTQTEYWVTLGPATGGSAFTVTSSSGEQVGQLTLNASATLDITGGVFGVYSYVYSYAAAYNAGVIDISHGATFQLGLAGSPSNSSGEIWNAGTVNVKGTLLDAGPWIGLYGAGTVDLEGGSIVGVSTSSDTLDNKTTTIAGYGTIGNGAGAGGLNLTNGGLQGGSTPTAGGTIDATGATAAEVLTLNTGSNWIENAGLIETTGAGGLNIDSNMYQDGQLKASGSGALTIDNVDVTGGGTVSIAKVGKIVLNAGQLSSGGTITIALGGGLTTTSTTKKTPGNSAGVGTDNDYVGDVLNGGDIENSGTVTIADNSTLNFNGSIYGTGKMDLSAATGPTTLEIFGDGAAFYETGGLVLSNSAKNSILSNGNGVQINNFAKITGAGTIGDGYLRLYNSTVGAIDANDSVGLTIISDNLAVGNGSESNDDQNAGTIETTGAGGLTITGTWSNSGYIYASGATAGIGALTLNGAQITGGGGIVATTAEGSIVLENNAQIYNQAWVSIASGDTLSTSAGDTSDAIETNVFNSGTVNVVNNSTLIAEGHWQNSGSVNIDGTANAATIEIEAGKTWQLFGGGTLNLNGTMSSILSGGTGTELTNKNNMIEGSGVIGDADMFVANQGGATIDATGTGGLTIDAEASTPGNTYIYNAGIMESNSAGGLTIETGMYNPGQLIANTGGNIYAEGPVYGPGTATINGTGSIEFGAEADNDVYFGKNATGTLILDDSPNFYGNIWGLASGDAVDLRDFVYNPAPGQTEISYPPSGFSGYDGTIVLSNGTSDSAPLYVEGNYTSAYLTANHLAFDVASDGHQIAGMPANTFGTEIKLVTT